MFQTNVYIFYQLFNRLISKWTMFVQHLSRFLKMALNLAEHHSFFKQKYAGRLKFKNKVYIFINIRDILTQMHTHLCSDYLTILYSDNIRMFFWYRLIAVFKNIFAFVLAIALVNKSSLKDVRSNILFTSLKFTNNSSSIFLDFWQNV